MIKGGKAPRVLWGCCLMSSSKAVSGDTLSMQAVPLLCLYPVPSPSWRLCYINNPLQFQGTALLGVRLSQGQESSKGVKLHLILIKATMMDVTPWPQNQPQRFVSPLCNFWVQNVGLCYDFAEKSMRLPLHRQWGALLLKIISWGISTLMPREQREDEVPKLSCLNTKSQAEVALL